VPHRPFDLAACPLRNDRTRIGGIYTDKAQGGMRVRYWQLRAEVTAEVERTRHEETTAREAAAAAASAAMNSERRAELAARSARRTQRTQQWQLPVPSLVPALLTQEVEQLERHHHERELSARHVHVHLLLLPTCCMRCCSRSPRKRETRLALPGESCSSPGPTERVLVCVEGDWRSGVCAARSSLIVLADGVCGGMHAACHRCRRSRRATPPRLRLSPPGADAMFSRRCRLSCHLQHPKQWSNLQPHSLPPHPHPRRLSLWWLHQPHPHRHYTPRCRLPLLHPRKRRLLRIHCWAAFSDPCRHWLLLPCPSSPPPHPWCNLGAWR
jgi:hypothetical protein